MKRKVLLRGVVLVLGLLLLACGNPAGGNTGSGGDGDGGDGDDVVLNGTWWVRVDGGTHKEIITFNSNGSFTAINNNGGQGTKTITGTYTVSGTTVTLSANGSVAGTMVVDGNTMNNKAYVKLSGTAWKWTDPQDQNKFETITFISGSNFRVDPDADVGTYRPDGYTVLLNLGGDQSADFSNITGITMKVGNHTYTLLQ